MAMLAERRTKRKWCLNPNGKDWSEDNNKFGQKMLEKMGWKKGCGLGINLQGQKEHVKVSVKNDSKGLGCDINYDLEWLNHQENYNALLSELSSSAGDGILTALEISSSKSLEDKSKTSRARVHYKKFVRGKDVSRYSGTDLKCILGKTEGATQKRPLDEIMNEVTESNPTITLKKKKKVSFGNHCSEDSDCSKSGSEEILYSHIDTINVVKKTESVIDEARSENSIENSLSETNDQNDKKKKKKKKKNSLVESEEGRDDEKAFKQMGPTDDIENKIPETNSIFNVKTRKKHKGDNSCVKETVEEYSDDCKSTNEGIVYSETEITYTVRQTESVDGIENICSETYSHASIKKKKKKKKKKNKNSSEESEEGHDEGFVEGSPKLKKSKVKKSVETIEMSSKNTVVLKEELQCKFQEEEEEEISFRGSNLHVVKGYKYDRK